jgi:para-nitrobenzyl esterase
MKLTRRGVLSAGAALAGTSCQAQPQTGSRSETIVETTEGRYRGAVIDGVAVFKGMRYGASTAGSGRFLPPRPPEPFAGVRDALAYGDQTPQYRGALAADTAMSEDCLRINVWTKEARPGRKRPVLLWFHGGGFESGSGSSPRYDGVHMVRRGDVVLATINHRLNVFGFCDLSRHLGPAYARSGNVGYLDLVAAMSWVRLNIEAFGGDPGNVMIYGQSGGGRKVSLCFAGKDAAGLFAKGVVQSGSHLMVQTPEQSSALVAALLAGLGLSSAEAAKLKDVPQDTLTEVQRKVIAKAGYRFEPVLDGITFDAHPFIPNAPRRTASVPMMVGTTRTELSNQLGRDPAIYAIDQAQLKERLASYYPPEDVNEAIAVFRAAEPDASATELFFRMTSWKSYIRNATIMAEKRAELNGAVNPTWMYQVTWNSPAEGGRRYAQHTIDLPFMFDNVDRSASLTGPETTETRYMTEAMAEAWLAFARNGDPNHPGIPHWPTYDTGTREVMQFEVPAKVVADPYRPERVFMERYDPVRTTARRDD